MPNQRHVLKIKYNQKKVDDALQAIREKRMTQGQASKFYGVPQTTLSDRITGRRSGWPKRGPRTILSQDQEDTLRRWIKDMNCCGFELVKSEVHYAVKEMLDNDKKTVSIFKDNVPGCSWWFGFQSRHPDVHLRPTTKYPPGEKLNRWFCQYRYILKRNNITNPCSVYVCNEPGFPLRTKTGKVIVDEFVQPCPAWNNKNNGKVQITAVLCLRADGAVVPPYIVFPGKNVRPSYTTQLPPECRTNATESGTITKKSFFNWFSDHFLHSLAPKEARSKVVLILDGHSSHRDLQTSALARENDVILLSMPSHKHSEPQPFLNDFLGSFKANWKQSCDALIKEVHSPIDKENFGHVFQSAFDSTFHPDPVTKAFESSGIWPVREDPNSTPSDVDPPFGTMDDPDETLRVDLIRTSIAIMPQHNSRKEIVIEPSIGSTAGDESESNVDVIEIVDYLDSPNLTLVENVSTTPRQSQRASNTSIPNHFGTTSTPNQSASASLKTPCARALEAIEATMSHEDKVLFEKRFEIERLTEDGLYVAWKHLKLELEKEQGDTSTTRIAEKSKQSFLNSTSKNNSTRKKNAKRSKNIVLSSKGSDSELESPIMPMKRARIAVSSGTSKRRVADLKAVSPRKESNSGLEVSVTPAKMSSKTNTSLSSKKHKNKHTKSKLTVSSSEETTDSEVDLPLFQQKKARRLKPAQSKLDKSRNDPLGTAKTTPGRRNEMRNAKKTRLDRLCGKCGKCFHTHDQEPPWICCDGCEWWYHLNCTNLNPKLTKPNVEKIKWLCSVCHDGS